VYVVVSIGSLCFSWFYPLVCLLQAHKFMSTFHDVYIPSIPFLYDMYSVCNIGVGSSGITPLLAEKVGPSGPSLGEL
jgi:hypothetical protein